MSLITDTGDDYVDYERDGDDYDDESVDTGSDSYKSISQYHSHRDHDSHVYGYKPKKKKNVYLPVYVAEKEKKKCKIFLCISVAFVRFYSQIHNICVYLLKLQPKPPNRPIVNQTKTKPKYTSNRESTLQHCPMLNVEMLYKTGIKIFPDGTLPPLPSPSVLNFYSHPST